MQLRLAEGLVAEAPEAGWAYTGGTGCHFTQPLGITTRCKDATRGGLTTRSNKNATRSYRTTMDHWGH